jgi:hypothetical protein
LGMPSPPPSPPALFSHLSLRHFNLGNQPSIVILGRPDGIVGVGRPINAKLNPKKSSKEMSQWEWEGSYVFYRVHKSCILKRVVQSPKKNNQLWVERVTTKPFLKRGWKPPKDNKLWVSD